MRNEGEPLVSVVTPFYNSAAFLRECVDSVLGQTYRNFEYVLVDNHSTDGSAAIAEEYTRRDPRIRFIRADQFRDQIPNYNYALRQISTDSRYVKFAQADDWLYPRCLTELVELAEAHPTVGVVSSYDLRGNESYGALFGAGLSPDQRVLSGREAARLYFTKWLFLFGSMTTVLYRGDVVRSRVPFYPEGTMHADTEVIFEILRDHDFGFVHQVLSFTRIQDDSISGRRQNLADRALDRLIIVKRFGRLYLDASEYDDTLRAVLKWYYDELGRRWIAQKGGNRNEEFWAYHRKGLGTIGETIQRRCVIRGVSRIVLRTLLNPGKIFRRLQQVGYEPPHRHAPED
jgi:glycosyltransferase involved in cell wall biosynthesis